MTREEKKLLLRELCVRLPYGIKAQLTELDNNDGSEYYTECRIMGVKDNQLVNFIRIIKSKEIGEDQWFDISFFKPYLRPMSSMTEEESKFYYGIVHIQRFEGIYEIDTPSDNPITTIEISRISELMDWFNKKMFDYRGLIEKGLALEAPKGMYN